MPSFSVVFMVLPILNILYKNLSSDAIGISKVAVGVMTPSQLNRLIVAPDAEPGSFDDPIYKLPFKSVASPCGAGS